MKTVKEKVEEFIKSLPVSNTCEYNANEIRQRRAFIAGYEKALRWINVKDELPPGDELNVSENVLLKFEVFNRIHKNVYTTIAEAYYDYDIKEWMIITPINEKNRIITPLCWRPIE